MIDTKAERRFAEAIYRYTTRNDEAAKRIDRLSYEVDRLRKELSSALRDEWVREDDHEDE